MNQNSSAIGQSSFDECNNARERLYNVLILYIVHVDVEMLIIFPAFSLLVVETQSGDDVRYACLLEGSRTAQREYADAVLD